MEPVFLSLEKVLEIHQIQIREFGGSDGLRDIGMLQSALAMPAAQFGGQYLHPGLHEMAAAYLYHLALNHPFVDGNKRVAAMATDVFLLMNGLLLTATDTVWADFVLDVAQRKMEKDQIAEFLKKHSRKSKS